MRVRRVLPILCSTMGLSALAPQAVAQEMNERAKESATAVEQTYGTEEGLSQNGFEPLTTEAPMLTVDGQPFQAQLACRATDQYLRVSLFPAATSDIARFSVEFDRDLDGSLETALSFTGPFSGVCNNGVIRCEAGTWNNCQYLRWMISGGVPALEEVTPRDLGACYCINSSCGTNLLLVNSTKVASDVGAGVVVAVQQVLPRMTMGRTEATELSVSYHAQSAACGADQSPEQYYTSPNELAAAGTVQGTTPGTVANFMLQTTVAQERGITGLSCEIRRELDTRALTKYDVLGLVSSTRGNMTDCGVGCMRFTVGDIGNNYYFGGWCTVFEETVIIDVREPERIESVTLNEVQYDDYAQVYVNGAQVFNARPGWGTGNFPGRCETRRHTVSTLWSDVTSYFTAAPGIVPLRLRTAAGDGGEGWAVFDVRVREGCEITREEVVDGCTAAQNNSQCMLRNEWVDDVQTVRDYRTTGFGPLPSSRPVGASCQVDSGERAWWLTRREYECRAEPRSYDGTAAADRYDSIHETFDPTTGNFTDRRLTGDNTYSLENNTLSLPEQTPTAGCIPTCRTRKLRPGVAVGEPGPQSQLNATGVPYDFTFRACDESNVCPVEPGEEVVGACDCRSNFAQAASLMQTIRMVGQDMVCTVPP